MLKIAFEKLSASDVQNYLTSRQTAAKEMFEMNG